jgi:hypothetical protein
VEHSYLPLEGPAAAPVGCDDGVEEEVGDEDELDDEDEDDPLLVLLPFAELITGTVSSLEPTTDGSRIICVRVT